MSRRPIGKPVKRRANLRRDLIPGFNASLSKLNFGEVVQYDLSPKQKDKTSLSRGIWTSPTGFWKATVVRCDCEGIERKMLLPDEARFIFHSKAILGRGPDRLIFKTGGEPTDGSTVLIARWMIGSGISKDKGPSGDLHDGISRQFLSSGGYVTGYTDIGCMEPFQMEMSWNDMALVWGASMQYLGNHPDLVIRGMEKILAFAHPIYSFLACNEKCRVISDKFGGNSEA